MSDDVALRVRQIIAREALLDLADVRPEARLDALGIDSLGLVESLFALEEEFDISVPFNANAPQEGALDLASVGSVIAAVERLIADQRA